MKLSIIIVNYNVKYFVHQCLDSIFRSDIEQKQVEVFVVDNASSDGSIGYLKKHFPARQYPRLHLIANSRNVGFGRANNQARHSAALGNPQPLSGIRRCPSPDGCAGHDDATRRRFARL